MNEDEQVAYFIGLIIFSIAVGTKLESVYGWLTFGGGLIVSGFLNFLIRKIWK